MSPACRSCSIRVARWAVAWGGRGIPTTHIIGRDGKERARLEGAADWSSPAAVALIQKLVG